MKNRNSLLDIIGNTPLIQLKNIGVARGAKIMAKCEFMNPGGSIKDRIALFMIEQAEKRGDLKPGDTILENSSGNTAMGLAFVAIQKGYKCKIVMRDSTSPAKVSMLRHLGVELELVDATLPPTDVKSYNNFAHYLAQNDPSLFYIDQHNNPDNNLAHYTLTGPEIWQQTGGNMDLFIAGIGTGGTLFGAGKYLKEQNPDIKIIGVDPYGSVFYDYYKSGSLIKPYPYKLEGLGDEFILPTVEFNLLDDMYKVEDKTAFEWTFKLAKQEGVLVGGSAGANVYAAVAASETGKYKKIVTVLPDSGYKYLTTIYDAGWYSKI